MSTKDKVKVVGEELDETKVARFLAMEPGSNSRENPDFHALLKAYRGLPAEAFERFLVLFKDSGRDVNARDLKGRTLLEQARAHIRHPEYVEILLRHGAQ